jgi:hypothetical protein
VRDGVGVESPAALEPEALLHELVEDPEEIWRSSWRSLCAAHASPARA